MIIKIDKRKNKFYFIVLFAVMLGLMFHLDRSMNMDFNRFQEIMDTIRNSKMSFSNFLADDTHMLKWSNITLPYMYSFNVLLFFVSRLFSNNYVMVWISVLIDYTIIAYIAYDWRRDSRYTQKEVMLSILICFSFLPFIHVCSGLRTATSACFMALAVYKYLYRDKGILIFALFALISITFHPIMCFAIPIALVIKLTNKKLIFYLTVLGCLFISRIADLFLISGNVFLRSLATKYITYTSEGQFRAYRFAMYGTIVFAILVILYYLVVYKRPKSEKNGRRRGLLGYITGSHAIVDDKDAKQRLFLFFSCYLALLIGNIGSYEMVCRGVYLVGASAPILADLLLSVKKNSNSSIAILIGFVIVLLLIYMCFSWIMYYYPYFIPFD